MNYRIGLDIGIGSVGWAAVRMADGTHPARIEDFGTRIFDSGENEKDRVSNCQERRGYRGVRRLERRGKHRKELLYNHFANIGLINTTFNDDLADCKDEEIYALKVKGLTEVLTPAELFKCMVHASNHRGYRDFYEPGENDDKEATKNVAAANAFEQAFHNSGLRTVSEYLLAEYSRDGKVVFRNHGKGEGEITLIRRGLLEDEIKQILTAQQKYHPQLTEDAVNETLNIIFRQRDFEDGPGDPNDKSRKYHGFLETLGQCTYYKDEKRGFRATVISDVYAVTNTLSQYRFIDIKTGEYYLSKKVARELVDFLLLNANITKTDINSILKKNGFKLQKSANSDDKALGKAVKFLKLAKSCLGEQWEDYIAEEQFDLDKPSRLHEIGELLSKYQTPRRREEEMKKAEMDKSIIKAFSSKKCSGTSSVSYRYMIDAINAFLEGDIYGNFQARTVKQHDIDKPVQRSYKLLPAQIDDPDVKSNRVVFKAVNETRKIVNAIIDIYGSPTEIVVEVARELGKSFDMRGIENARQRKNEKTNDEAKNDIAKLLNIDVSEVKGDMLDRFKLFHEQGGKCIYSGKELGGLIPVLLNRNKEYEIDHIVPFSLILDNTLNNKALVFTGENQKKGQRTPLMYMTDDQKKSFLASVNQMYSRKDNQISKIKYQYFTLETIYGEQAQEILSGWKSRNINDTRYITKYVVGILNRYLQFAGDENKRHVLAVRGAVTQKFRTEWLRTSPWGAKEKPRDSYLNHAVDAVIVANLTLPYIELGSDALRLRSIYYFYKKQFTNEYYDYLENCVTKMRKYYGFGEEYTRNLLKYPERIPSYVPDLLAEINCRTTTGDEAFAREIERLYGQQVPFVLPPQRPMTSFKQERKFSGAICDDKPVKLVEIDGKMYKVARKDIKELSASELDRLYTGDPKLIAQLRVIFEGKGEKYTVENYLKENNLPHFTDMGGQKIRSVSVREKSSKSENSYYRKEYGEQYTNLSGMKYYCVEVYRSKDGKTKLRGMRFVDIVKQGKKLYQKPESIPEDYGEHIMYLQKNDFIRVWTEKGELKFEGFYQSVKNLNEDRVYMKAGNEAVAIMPSFKNVSDVKKYDVTLLGRIGGEIKCSEPLPFIGEKK